METIVLNSLKDVRRFGIADPVPRAVTEIVTDQGRVIQMDSMLALKLSASLEYAPGTMIPPGGFSRQVQTDQGLVILQFTPVSAGQFIARVYDK